MDIQELLAITTQKKASDLHLSSGVQPMLRIDGEMEFLHDEKLDNNTIQSMAYSLMSETQKEEFNQTMECDFSISEKQIGARFRVNIFKQDRGISVVFRTIPEEVLSLSDINAPEIFRQILDNKNGLVLVTGPTGSGKSTTLAAMIDHINHHKAGHIISIEDPIEFVHQCDKCLINQREVKRDTLSFANALKAILREDPDYILIGEMRDIETIRLALTAAETGHLVFATLHTSSAPKTIDRVINVFPAEEQSMIRAMLSESLCAIISQTLLKKKTGGRVAAHEILIANSAIRNLIRENKLPQIYNTLQTNQSIGMQTLDQSLQKLYAQGLINDPNDARNLR
ncbi:type IV pilus twitching motility protein PilT [Fangia hongkongensis]|uniref:type IV pilus twitching motility protein PilT n=1 Tax=Fangia hongkongensis TaxID=270495 RepID=UPI00037E9775|nr:type IV pilus twitching motility protein PilT [Fangia hongkongensis]MBK2124646.1 type IV pilus twitching motility protein PilT [Fangia hongkongensis]